MKKTSAPSRSEFRNARACLSARPIDELIRLLESEDLGERFLAEMCLRDATGT
jgi:hypothetical protein